MTAIAERTGKKFIIWGVYRWHEMGKIIASESTCLADVSTPTPISLNPSASHIPISTEKVAFVKS
jgi:hypothetical protein